MKFTKRTESGITHNDEKNGQWHKWFALIPVSDGTYYFWFQTICRRWSPELNEVPDGHFSVCLGGWEYADQTALA